ncbi:MAG: hypothetical protein M1814_002105 [Vezdaea aestivalis]|nr:MAG: hypothetical protein M1814_002105 [Vezdaea aestivalis]
MTIPNEKVILVTGASRGIGEAIARCLLQPPNPHKVVLCARSAEPLESIRSNNEESVAVVVGDASTREIGQACVKAATERWGRLDAAIFNHAVLDPVSTIADADLDAWRRAFEVNVFGLVGLVQAVLLPLRKSNGRIILTSSGAAVKGYPTWGAYGAAKAAVNHLALTLQAEEKDIITIAVRPGVVDTDMQRTVREDHSTTMDQEVVQKYIDMKNNGQLLRPDQPGNVIARLAVSAGRELNGCFLNWDDERVAAFQD